VSSSDTLIVGSPLDRLISFTFAISAALSGGTLAAAMEGAKHAKMIPAATAIRACRMSPDSLSSAYGVS
jgi:hypothetical protein